jgi:acyl dehydratase
MTTTGRPEGAVVLGTPGGWTEEFAVDVTPDQTMAYAAATNERDERFRSGKVAPPMFATVPVRPAVRAAFEQSMPQGLPTSVPRLAGEQDMRFHRPIVPGRRLRSRARFLGIAPKSSGTVLVYHLETRADTDDVLTEQYMTTFLPGVRWPTEAGERAPERAALVQSRSGSPLARVVQQFDRDQTFRYSAASGDPSRWHLDDAVARAAGLPGIIIHGLCTMAFLARALAESVADGDVLRVRRLAVRFSRPIFPGDAMTTEIWAGDRTAAGRIFVCESTRPDGERVITGGLAEVAE